MFVSINTFFYLTSGFFHACTRLGSVLIELCYGVGIPYGLKTAWGLNHRPTLDINILNK